MSKPAPTLRRALLEALELLQCERDSLFDCHKGPDGQVHDAAGAWALAKFDAVIGRGRAALQQSATDPTS